MKEANAVELYSRLERLTRRRIFYMLLILIPAILPPLAASGLGYLRDLPNFSLHVAEALFDYKTAYAGWMPGLHAAMLLALALMAIFRRKAGRFFAVFVAINFGLSVYTQTMVMTRDYGLVILTEIFLWYCLVIALWLWEAALQKNDLSFQGGNRPWWMIPLAVLAFWDPDQAWDLSPAYFIDGFAPVAFCMLSPIYLTVLMFAFPRVNLPLVRIQSFTGLIVGFISLFISLLQSPAEGVYWVLLHTPLIAVSLYAFRRSLRMRPEAGAAEGG